jgi:hypothetical protein
MRECCNKKEDNFITYHQNREKEIVDILSTMSQEELKNRIGEK